MSENFDMRVMTEEDRANWSRLIDDHERIANQCVALAMMAQEPSTQSMAASRKLIELAVSVADHLGVEDEVIDRTAVAMGARYSADTIAMMAEDLDILRSDWKTFIARWLPIIMPNDWQAFGEQADSMLDRLATQVKLETEILYDNALRDGVVRPGAPVLH